MKIYYLVGSVAGMIVMGEKRSGQLILVIRSEKCYLN